MVFFLDAKSGEPFRVFDGHQSPLKAIMFSPMVNTSRHAKGGPPMRYACGKGVGPCRLQGRWKIAVGRMRGFQPQGRHSGRWHVKEITFWDWKAGKLLKEIPANYAQALAFSTDGAKLASGDRDGTIHVYDWMNGKELQKFHNGTKAPTP